MEIKKIDTRVVIIGAGITGLTTAYYLKKKGIDFIIIDKAQNAGGVISTHAENGFVYETGPNTGVLSQPETLELIQELKDSCKLEIANAAAKKRWIWQGDSWQALPSGFKAAVKTPLFSMADKIRILAEPFRPKGKNPDETLAQLVRRRMGESFLNYAVDPFILGIYSGDPSYLVTRFALPKLYNLEQKYGSFIGGAVRKGFEKKDERAKLATGDVFSIKGGLKHLIDALIDRIGPDTFIMNAVDTTVSPLENGLKRLNSTGQGKNFLIKTVVQEREVEIHSDFVITTTGSHELPKLLPFISASEAADINNLIYAKVLQVTLGFNKWEGIPLDAFGGLVPFIEKRDVLGILFLSSFLSERAPQGGALLSVFMGGVRKPHLTELSDNEVMKILSKEVMAMIGLTAFKPDLLKITRYTHAIPQYGLSTGERLEAVDRLQKQYPGLIIGGNLRNGIGMSDRIKQGKEIADTFL